MLIRYTIQLWQTTSSLPPTDRCQCKGEVRTCKETPCICNMDAYDSYDSYLMTSVSSGIPGKHQSKYGGYSANLLHTGDTTKDTNNPCKDILINVIFGCETELEASIWSESRTASTGTGTDFCPCQAKWQGAFFFYWAGRLSTTVGCEPMRCSDFITWCLH